MDKPRLPSGEIKIGFNTETVDLQLEQIAPLKVIGNILPLAFLVPNVVESIIAGKQPADLTTDKLLKTISLPIEWADQSRILGIA